MITVDSRCPIPGCADRGVYRMVGDCTNCAADGIVILLTAGHSAGRVLTCPVCGCLTVRALRLAASDEVPAS